MKNRNKAEKILLHSALLTGALTAAVILMVSIVDLNLVGIVSEMLQLCIIVMPIMLIFHKGIKAFFILLTVLSCIGLLLPCVMSLQNSQSIENAAVSIPYLSLIAYVVIGICSVRMTSAITPALSITAAAAAGAIALKTVLFLNGALFIGHLLASICVVLFFTAVTLLFIIIKLRSQRWYCPCGFRNSPNEKFCGGCGKLH